MHTPESVYGDHDDSVNNDDHLETSGKDLTCASVLWAYPFWMLRKNMVFDFSKPSPREHEVRTTIDMDWRRACHILGQKQNLDYLITPVEMPKKTRVISMDASVNKDLAHVLRRSANQTIGLMTLLPLMASLLPLGTSIPRCFYMINYELVNISSQDLARKKKEYGSFYAWLKSLGTDKEHDRACGKKGCLGLSTWRAVIEDPFYFTMFEAFAERYIRSVIVPRPSQPIVIIKISEVSEEDPFADIRNSTPKALWGSIDPVNMTIRHKMTVRYPADVDMLKCIPPNQAYFAPTDLLEDPTDEDESPSVLQVHPSGAWAYRNLPSERKGSMTEFRSAVVDIIARRAPLIFPGLVISLLGFLSQLYILLHIATGTTQPRDVVANPVVSAVTIALPVGAATYISISRHALITRYLAVYRNWLLSASLIQIATTAVASLDKSRSLLFAGIGFCSSLLVFTVFIDATAQGNHKYYRFRLRFCKELRELPVLWNCFFLLWLATSTGMVITLAMYRENSVQPNIEYLVVGSSDATLLLLSPCVYLALLPIGVFIGKVGAKWWPILLGLCSITWVGCLALQWQYPNGWFFAIVSLLLVLYVMFTCLTLYGASHAFHATLCPRCAEADSGCCYLE